MRITILFVLIVGLLSVAPAFSAEHDRQSYVGTGVKLFPIPMYVEAPAPDITRNVIIMALACDGPAYSAGLRRDDFVLSIDGQKVIGITEKKLDEIIAHITSGQVGGKVVFQIMRVLRGAGVDEVQDFTIEIERATISDLSFNC